MSLVRNMELPNIKIYEEFDPILRKISKDVSFPLSSEDKQLIFDTLQYLKMSQIDEYREKYDLRAGMGMAFIQLGFDKRIFVISEDLKDGNFKEYVVINPKVVSESTEKIFVDEGEGCLSVNRDVEGIVPRSARVTIQAYDENGNEYSIRIREDLSVAFQHEIDHLNGILFTDRIDKKNPYKDYDNMRPI